MEYLSSEDLYIYIYIYIHTYIRMIHTYIHTYIHTGLKLSGKKPLKSEGDEMDRLSAAVSSCTCVPVKQVN